jgi:hypothetical protein
MINQVTLSDRARDRYTHWKVVVVAVEAAMKRGDERRPYLHVQLIRLTRGYVFALFFFFF